MVEEVVICYDGKEHALEVESQWTVFRVILVEMVHLERIGHPVSVEDEMELLVTGKSGKQPEVLRSNLPLLSQTRERRFELRKVQTVKANNRESFRIVRSTSRLRAAASSSSSQLVTQPASVVEEASTPLTSKEKLKMLPKKALVSKSDFLRVVILGDDTARRKAALAVKPDSLPNMLQVSKLGEISVSQIELVSMDALSMFAAPKALFILALDAGEVDEDELVQRARGLVRAVSSKLPSGCRPQLLMLLDGASVAAKVRIQAGFRSVLKEIVESASSIPGLLGGFVQRQIPFSFNLMLMKLAEIGANDPIVSLSLVKEKSLSVGLQAAELSSALQFAHDIGFVLHFPMHALLCKYVVLDLDAVLELLGSLLRYSNNFPLGVASPSSIETIWKLSPIMTQIVLRVLAELGLLFVNVIPSSTEMVTEAVVPAGLSKRDVLRPSMVGERRFSFSFLDQALFDRLMAGVYMQKNVTVVDAWRNGLECQQKGEESQVNMFLFLVLFCKRKTGLSLLRV